MTRKRGGSEAQRKLHDYLVSKSVRANKALDGLQEVGTQFFATARDRHGDSFRCLRSWLKAAAFL